MEWERSTTIMEVRSFLGLAGYYRRFIKGFSRIALPMTKLTRKEVPFVWTSECEEIFQTLNQSILLASLRIYRACRRRYLDSDLSTISRGFPYKKYEGRCLHGDVLGELSSVEDDNATTANGSYSDGGGDDDDGDGGVHESLLSSARVSRLCLHLARVSVSVSSCASCSRELCFPDVLHCFPAVSSLRAPKELEQQTMASFKEDHGKTLIPSRKPQTVIVARRPDSGGKEGSVISLLANHFLVQFDSSQKIYHYNVEITPHPSKEVARAIKQNLVDRNSDLLSGALPAYDGRKNLYSPVEFQNDKLEFYISLPIPTSKLSSNYGDVYDSKEKHEKLKLFRINVKLVSKINGKELSSYLSKEGDDWIPLPQDYLHALDVVLRESPTEKCIPVGRSFYSNSMGRSKDIGGGAVGLRGFFQSLRPTQQGLALNVDFSVTAFHESIGVIPYLQKRLEFLRDLSQKKTAQLTAEERKEVEKALKNIRIFVCHRETVQRYRVYGLTEDITENLWFADRDGRNLRLLTYFKDHYNYDIQFRKLPCLQISRSKPCYLPMELCVICEGQKFLGKLSDDQTARILKMGCQRPGERKTIIEGVMRGQVGPTSGDQEREFKLNVSREMTRLNGRILHPPKLKLGEGGHVRNLTPSRHDRQWNLLDGHVFEGTKIERWALMSFGGTSEQKSNIPRFINQLTQRCEQLGIYLNKNTVISPQFESSQVLNNPLLLESKLKKIQRSASNNLQLLICIMERKHKGYAFLKRIAETSVGVVSQCCLYPNLSKLSSQFLANLALKINAKVGGCTVALYNSLPSQIPRLFQIDEPAIFMGADVTHPHPLDDFSPSVAAVVGSMNWPTANKYISRIRSQTHRQEIIQDLGSMVGELLEDFYQEVEKLPGRIIFFRDGVSETQFYKVLQEELQSIRTACSRFQDYKPLITFAVVQKRHHTRLFPFELDQSSTQNHFLYENIPPGTVVDSVITHPKEFDFYLCSHWGVKGTSRPTHYHVLWDENQFTSDELQKLVYNLCYTFVRCTKPISLVPPAYYAHLAAYRGRLYLERSSESLGLFKGSSTLSRAAPPKTAPLPKLSENIKKLMFYC
ncbi:protein argonaute 7 [Arachis duranensis]|uniref:Protein argonaute 7 n=1 Tax=Arachis duranensis TaxID=130453 RepID=A0A6P4BQ38_ARADU|nr:protein argonaute 7 [Arachis duranensis]